MVLAGRTIIVALVVGTLVTVLAGLIPAWRATRIQPEAALREAGPDGHRVRLPGRIVRTVTGIVGRPAQLIGGSAGVLARRNAMRNPGRVISTALALTIGLALVTAITVLGQGLKDSTSGQLERQISASRIIVDKDGWTPITPAVERAAAATPGVRVATSIRQDGALAYGKEAGLNTVDPAKIAKVFDFKWKQGNRDTIASLGSDGAVIDSNWATKHRLGVGDHFQITSAGGHRMDLQVRGIEDAPVINGLGLGPITISRDAAKAAKLQATRNRLTLVDAPGSADAALRQSLAGFPEVKLQTKHAYVKALSKQISSIVGVFNVLLALAVIVSLFGLVNALVLATFERTREIGMLRAVGMTRRQVRRMVRHESVITAMIGAIAGVGVGFGIAALAVAKWGSDGLSLGVPVGSLVAYAVVAVIAGVVAAVLPARRAARLDVLSALAYE
jgi:putative ABC transport system permease protein